jgi:pyrroline-5-carboxylate reductase
MDKKIGIIGFGNMGSVIAERIKGKYKVVVFDKDKEKTKSLTEIKVANTVLELIENTDVVILAVKPQDFDIVLSQIKDYAKDKLIISIAAGITTDYIENRLGGPRVVRVMPNLPAKIGKGMICLCKGKHTKKRELDFTQQLFDNLGSTLNVKEGLMNAVTALSGSGPGYLYEWAQGKTMKEVRKYMKSVFIPSLRASAQGLGFSLEEARILAEATGEGSVVFLEKSGLLPVQLKNQVASKGGTTEAGLEVLRSGGSLQDAVKAALKRAKELSRGVICQP